MFAGCTGLYNFDFKDHIEIIDDEAFYGCVNLGAKTLNELFPDKYQTTTESSSRVNSIELNKVTTIGYAVFYGCTSLVNLTFNETLTKLVIIRFTKIQLNLKRRKSKVYLRIVLILNQLL